MVFPCEWPITPAVFPYHDVIIIITVVFSVTCDPGMEAKGGDTCEDCQADFYKVTPGVQNCTACPGPTTTEGVTAATELNQCVGKCTYVSNEEIPQVDGFRWLKFTVL